MPKTPRKRRVLVGLTLEERTCTTKRKFVSEAVAILDAKRLIWRGLADHLYTYECPFCDGWHLSSRLTDWTCVEG